MRETKQTLTRMATETIQRDGVHGLSFRTLGAMAGIKSASVHYHFGNKNSLLHTVARHYTDDFIASLQALTGSPAQQLDGMVDLFASTLDAERGCLCGVLAITPDALDAPTRDVLARYFDVLEDWADARAPGLGGVIVSALEGALLIDRLDRQRERLLQVRRWVASLGAQ